VRFDAQRSLTSFQQTALIILRTAVGWHFLYEGIYKLRLPAWSADGHPLAAWTSAGFIKGAASGPLAKLATSAVSHGFLAIIDKALMVGITLVGLSLILGLLTRLGCIGGVLLLSLFYFLAIPTTGMPQTGAEGNYLIVNKTLIEGVAVLLLAAFDTGQIAGLDRLWRRKRYVPPVLSTADRQAVGQGSGT
jgi:thiosulfate dehydrogenase (quinone) large subunit